MITSKSIIVLKNKCIKSRSFLLCNVKQFQFYTTNRLITHGTISKSKINSSQLVTLNTIQHFTNNLKSELGDFQIGKQITSTFKDRSLKSTKQLYIVKKNSLWIVSRRHFSVKYNKENSIKIINMSADYERFLIESPIFLDRTKLIKVIFESPLRVILITMPDNWGKTLNLNMIYRFMSVQKDHRGKLIKIKEEGDNYKLFFDRPNNSEESLDITTEKIIFNGKLVESKLLCCTRPVIYLNLDITNFHDYESFEQEIKILVYYCYRSHDYLSTNDELRNLYFYQMENIMNFKKISNIFLSLNILSELLYRHFGFKVWVLIDEYETVINKAILELDEKEAKKISQLFGQIFKNLLLENEFLEKAVLNGIKYIAECGIMKSFGIEDFEISQFYGLNQDEADLFFQHFKIDELKRKQIKEWYNGYKIPKNFEGTLQFQDRYSIRSVVNCLNFEDFGKKSLLKDYLLVKFLKQMLRN
jgi:hypothetical protein